MSRPVSVSFRGAAFRRQGAKLGYTFDASDYTRFTGGTATSNPTEYTISAWVKPASVASVLSLVFRSDGNPATTYSHMLLMATDKFIAYTYDGNTKTVNGTTVPIAGDWHHVAATAKNAGFQRLYVNGVEEGNVVVGTLWAGGNDWWIARSTGNVGALSPGNFNGDLCDVAVWNKELTAGEIATLANGSRHQPSRVQPASLILYCRMIDAVPGETLLSDWTEEVGGLTQTRTGSVVGASVSFF